VLAWRREAGEPTTDQPACQDQQNIGGIMLYVLLALIVLWIVAIIPFDRAAKRRANADGRKRARWSDYRRR